MWDGFGGAPHHWESWLAGAGLFPRKARIFSEEEGNQNEVAHNPRGFKALKSSFGSSRLSDFVIRENNNETNISHITVPLHLFVNYNTKFSPASSKYSL